MDVCFLMLMYEGPTADELFSVGWYIHAFMFSILLLLLLLLLLWTTHTLLINPFKPKFTIVIFIHHKSRIAVAILDL